MLQLNEHRQSPQPPAVTPPTSVAVLAAALDALPLPVSIVDAELQVLHINAAADELTAPERSGLTVSRAGLSGPRLRARRRGGHSLRPQRLAAWLRRTAQRG